MVYLWYGIFYSFLGWGLEKAFAAATRSKHRLRRCFVFLPLCPVYGLGMLAVLALGTEHVPSLWARVLLGAFAATVVEYAVHAAYEKLFAVRFWDYSATKCDVNGRICLPFSLCWGFLLALDGLFTCRVLLLTHDIDALTPHTLLETMKRRTA